MYDGQGPQGCAVITISILGFILLIVFAHIGAFYVGWHLDDICAWVVKRINK